MASTIHGLTEQETAVSLDTSVELIIALTDDSWVTEKERRIAGDTFSQSLSAAGSDTHIQYNSSGSFAGSGLLTYDGTTLYIDGQGDGNQMLAKNSSSGVAGFTCNVDGGTLGSFVADGTDSNKIKLRTAAVDALSVAQGGAITTIGNLGVGGDPSYRLHVTQSTAGLARHQFLNTNTGDYYVTDLDIGRGTGSQDIYIGTNFGTAQNAYIDNRSGGSLKVMHSGTDAIVIDSTRRIGFAESAPDSKLEINCDSDIAGLHIKANAGQTVDIVTVTDSSDVDLVVINSAGKVGVGTGSPQALLHIFDSDVSEVPYQNSHLVLEDSAEQFIEFLSDPDIALMQGIMWSDGSTGQGRIAYIHSDDSFRVWTAGAEAFRVTSSGKIGIGAVVPATTLELEEDHDITQSVTDEYSACLTLDPGYSADSASTFTITRHNYIAVTDVTAANAGAGDLNLTDACLLRFDNNLGTHKATTNSDKTSNSKSGTIKVNINGTLYHIQLYADS